MSTSNCPSREELFSYLVGTLTEDRAEAILDHIESCPDCQRTLDTIDQADDTLIARLRQPVQEEAFAEEPQRREAFARAKALAGQFGPAGEDRGTESGADPLAGSDEPAILGELGEYQLLAKLGQGGMGAVYKARQTKLKRIVALKVLPKSRMEDERAVARFEREMAAVGQLSHPNIVQAHDARDINGTPVLAMEYIEGLDLSELVAQLGPLPVANACELARQAAEGLQAAHKAGLVHRDIKPSNLMLAAPLSHLGRGAGGEGNQPVEKILDLGLALLGAGQPDGAEMTGTGQAMGTADYMAPEQCSDSHTVDIRADIYSLGCTLYKLLSGHAPFSGPQYKKKVEKMAAHLRDPIPPITDRRHDIPDELVAILERMLAKNPAERYAAPSDVADSLASFCTGCDLDCLAGRARGEAAEEELTKSLAPTAEYLSSAQVGTESAHPSKAQPAPLPTARRWKRWVIAAAIGLLLIGPIAAWQIIIRIQHPDGTETVLETSGKSKITIERRDKGAIGTAPAQPDRAGTEPPTTRPIKIEPKPLQIEPGQPMSGMALVSRPATVSGAAAWTIDTREHRGRIFAVAYSPDGRLLATGGEDGTIRLRDPDTGRVSILFVGHGEDIVKLAWLPDGKTLACLDSGFTVSVWDVISGRLLRECRHGNSGHHMMEISPTGRTLAITIGDCFVGFWEPASKEGIRKPHLPPNTCSIQSLAWSPNGRLAASLTTLDGNQLVVWDEQTAPVHVLGRGGPLYFNLAWSPNGRLLAVYNGLCSVEIWDTTSRKCVQTFQANDGYCYYLAWSPDGKRLASLQTRRLDIWEVESGKRTVNMGGHQVQFPYGCRGDFEAMGCWSPDGNTIAVGGRKLSFWDTHSGKFRRAIGIHKSECSFAWSPNGKRAAVAAPDRTALLGDFRSGQRLVNLTPSSNAFRWSPDGNTLATGSRDNATVVLWDAETGQSAHVLRRGGNPVRGVHWSPDGQIVSAETDDGKVPLWDAVSGDRLIEIEDDEGPLHRLSWSPDSAMAASLSHDRQAIRLWHPKSGELLRELRGHSAEIRTFAWSPDGKTLATGSDDKSARLWDVETGRCSHVLEGHTGSVGKIVWSPQGKSLVTMTILEKRPYVVMLWDVASGKGKKCSFASKRDVYMCWRSPVAWMPDGKRIGIGFVVYDVLCGFHIWETDAQRDPVRLPVETRYADHDGTVFLRWSPDGKWLTSGHYDGALRTWDALAGGQLRCVYPHPTSRVSQMVLSPSGDVGVSVAKADTAFLWRTESGDPIVALALFPDDQDLLINPDGHYQATSEVEEDLVYVIQTETGQETLTPDEFSKKYGWKNDPAKVSLEAESGKRKAEDRGPEPDTPAPKPITIGPAMKVRPAEIKIEPEPVEIKPGEPLDKMALVGAPEPVEGAVSWTIETIGHRGPVICARFSPDSRQIASTGYDNAVRIWDAQKLELVGVIAGGCGALDWSPDGRMIAAGGPNGTVGIWEAASGRRLKTLSGLDSQTGFVDSIDWSADGRRIAAGAYNEKVKVWDVESGACTNTLKGLPDRCGDRGIAWFPDASVLALACSGSGLQCLNRSAEERFGDLGDAGVHGVVWSPDGSSLAVATRDEKLVVLDSRSGKLRWEMEHRPLARIACWSPDGETIALGREESIGLFDAASGRETRTISTVRIYGAWRRRSTIDWAGNGATLVVGMMDGSVVTYDVSSGARLYHNSGHKALLHHAAYSPDESRLALGCNDHVWIFAADSGRLVRRIDEFGEAPSGPHPVWSPDGKTIAAGTYNIRLWNAESGAKLQDFRIPQGPSRSGTAVAWSPDGNNLAVGENDVVLGKESDRLVVWSVGSGEILLRTEPAGHAVGSAFWSPDGKRLAAQGDGRKMPLWDAESGKLLTSLLPDFADCRHSIAWSPDGKVLAAAGDSRAIHLWERDSGKRIETLVGHQDGVLALAWPPDGATLLSVGQDRTVREWGSTTGSRRTVILPVDSRFRPFQYNRCNTALSPSANYVTHVALRGDPHVGDTVYIWNAKTGRPCGTIMPLRNDGYLSISAQGHYHGSSGVESQFVYVVLTDKGQETLTPEQFSKRYGWKNDPEKVTLKAESRKPKAEDRKVKPDDSAEK